MLSKIKAAASKHQNWLAFLLFVVLAVVVLEANPFAGETVGPFDLLLSYSGYSSVAPANLDVRCKERSDVLDARLPGWIKHKQEFYYNLKNLSTKKLALVENLYVMIWKPGMFLFTCIPNDTIAFYFSQLIKLIIAGFGTYLFLKIFLSFPASLFGGIVYMLCGFNAAWFFWPQVDTAIWIPWLFWAVAGYLISDKARYLFLITLVTVFLIKGAFPAVAAYGFYAAALFILIYNLFNRKNIISFLYKSLVPLLFIALGFMISSDYLLKMVNITKNVDMSYRAQATTRLDIEDISHLYKYEPDRPLEFNVENSVYIGTLAFIFSLLSFLYFFVKKKAEHWKSGYFFSLFLLIISVVIGYGLLPHSFIRKIPMFSSNPWNRLSVLIGLSAALLSSFFIEFVYWIRTRLSKVVKWAVPVLIMAGLLVQFVDQKRYFNQFNGPTPSRYFYPMTPSLSFVKKNIQDYQSIIADHSFNIAGTLSSYSFFEWFGHSFKTNEEKKLLYSLVPHSYSSPTSFLILGKNIDYTSPLMDLMAVKFILINPKFLSFTKTPYFFKQPEKNHTPSPPLPFNTLCQHFYVSQTRRLAAVTLKLGNYRNKRFNSDVLLKLYDSQNKLLGISEKDKRYIEDNTWVYFEFEEPVTLNKGEFKFSLELANPRAPVMLSGWSTKRTKKINSYLKVNGEETELSFKYFLHKASDWYEKNYEVHRMEPTVAVVENRVCPKGPYLISDLNDDSPPIKNRHLEYESSLGEIKIHIPQGSKGYVVIPRPNHHYLAYVDGEKKTMERYLDVMPAVYVENNTQVHIKEKLFFPLTGFLISFFSLLFFILLWFYLRKKKSLSKIS